MKDVFILGCERCGSTWLANIFDAHPDVEFIMEPFADYATLFPSIPGRNRSCPPLSADDIAELQRAYDRLTRLKYPFLYKPGGPLALQRSEQRAADFAARVLRGLHRRPPASYFRYRLLQLNTLNTPVKRLGKKSRQPSHRVTKDLRLNFKAGMLGQVFPGAPLIVCIRNPGAQIASILRLRSTGSMSELARAAGTFAQEVRDDPQRQPLASVLGLPTRNGTFEDILPAWWILNYSTLLSDIDRLSLPHHRVYHEDLARDPVGRSRDILAAVGLDEHPAVTDYVRWSSEQTAPNNSPISTTRQSATYVQQALDAVPATLRQSLQDLLRRTHEAGMLHPALQRYLGPNP